MPSLDYTVAESALNLPLRLRLRGTVDKWIVKAVAEHYLSPDWSIDPRTVPGARDGIPVRLSRLFDIRGWFLGELFRFAEGALPRDYPANPAPSGITC